MIAPRHGFPPAENTAPGYPREGVAARGVAVRPADFESARAPAGESRGDGVTPRRRFWLRVLFALDVVGAGGPGVLMLVAPEKAGDLLFAADLEPNPATAVLGCIWVALGALSIAGLLRPVAFSPVLLVQFGYKLVWLAAVGLPAALAGESLPPVATAVFAGWVVAVGAAAPWGVLFGPCGPGTTRIDGPPRPTPDVSFRSR